jgi:putative Holliday junction resolvase
VVVCREQASLANRSRLIADEDHLHDNQDSSVSTGIIDSDALQFRDRLTAGRRLIGIDLGTSTIGLALSDVTRMIASALETLTRTKFKADSARLLQIVAAHDVCGFVLGLPINLDGKDGPRAQASRAFARNLSRIAPLPILLWDERLSTAEAERMLIAADASRRRRAEVIDKLAATIILQGALDRMRDLD